MRLTEIIETAKKDGWKLEKTIMTKQRSRWNDTEKVWKSSNSKITRHGVGETFGGGNYTINAKVYKELLTFGLEERVTDYTKE